MNQALSLMRHIRAQTTLGNQILIALGHYQLQSGLSQSVLIDTRLLPHMNIPWFDTLRQYLKNINGNIKITDLWRPTLQRTNNCFLMENILALKRFTTKELQLINACCMYYQVIRVSDIATSDGSRIPTNIILGKTSRQDLNKVYVTPYEWPEQPKPSVEAWKLWTKALQLPTCNESSQLNHPLGPWNHTLDDSWIFYFSTVDNYLYQYNDNQWTRYEPIRLGRIQNLTTVDKIRPNRYYPTPLSQRSAQPPISATTRTVPDSNIQKKHLDYPTTLPNIYRTTNNHGSDTSSQTFKNNTKANSLWPNVLN
jgi:hypothetical protein